MGHSISWVRRHVAPIGIDLGRRCIRMLQLGRDHSRTTVVGSAHRVVPPGRWSPEEYERFAARAVREMLKEGGFIGSRVVTALGWDDLRVRNLRIWRMPENEVGQAIRRESLERLGLEAADAEIRFLIAGDVRQGTDIRQEVLVLGAPRSSVEARTAWLARLGLCPVAVDAGPCALFRGFERFLRRDDDHQAVSAIVDLGYRAARVVISRGTDLIFFKSIPIGGQRFEELISGELNLSLDETVRLRLRLHLQQVGAMTGRAGKSLEDETVAEPVQRAMLDALRPALEQLSKEIALCLRYCSVTFRGLRSHAVTVVGGEACNADILRVLSDQVNVPFHPGRPLRNIACDRDFDGIDRRTGQPEWATAMGLALKPSGAGMEAAS